MSIWQSNGWKNLVLDSNQASDVFEVDGIFVEKRSIGLGKFGLFALGIENTRKIDEEKLIDLSKKQNCLFIQLETFGIDKSIDLKLKKFKSGHYKKFITPYTAVIDLSKTEDEILKEMKPKGRYNINLAQKKGVEVFESSNLDNDIKIFYDLILQTTSRNRFHGNSLEYYKKFLENIRGSLLIFTKFEDKVLSGGIFVFDKEISTYYYGASTSDKNYKNLMASYLMQWYAIKKAKSIGSKYYDFLGVASPTDKNSSLTGVTDFKLKFTSNVKKVSESYIRINNKLLHKLLVILKNLKKLVF